MEYEMEELVPIVAKLAEKYTSHESTSITYEKAEQLMGAVLYCIHEAEQSGQHSAVPAEGISARRAYETGAAYVKEKTKKALDLYNEVLAEFISYENDCLYDTFARGLPEFFKWYDSQFEPQNTVLMLDYPVLRDISGYTGIDKVYEFIMCISLEQKFLNAFPEDYVLSLLSKYNGKYKETAENICEIVLLSVIGHILAGRPLSEPHLEEGDYLHIQELFLRADFDEVNKRAGDALEALVREYYGGCSELLEYLTDSVGGILVRLKNAAAHNSLYRIL